MQKFRHPHRIQTMGSKPVHPPPNKFYAWPRELGKKNFAGAMRNRLGMYLFVRFCFFFNFVFSSVCTQSTRSCSKRIFLRVNATQLGLVSLESVGPVLVHPTKNKFYACPRNLGGKKTMVGDMRENMHVSLLFAMVLMSFSNHFQNKHKFFFQTYFPPCKCHRGRHI